MSDFFIMDDFYTINTDGSRTFADLPERLKDQLSKIQSIDGAAKNSYPCSVILDDEKRIDSVYIAHADDYINHWGSWPGGKYKNAIDIARVKIILESPYRLPVKFAKMLYEAGESNMGGSIFTLLFDDDTRQVYSVGGALDFLEMPQEKTINDIVGVMPHEGRKNFDRLSSLNYFWCLYGTGKLR